MKHITFTPLRTLALGIVLTTSPLGFTANAATDYHATPIHSESAYVTQWVASDGDFTSHGDSLVKAVASLGLHGIPTEPFMEGLNDLPNNTNAANKAAQHVFEKTIAAMAFGITSSQHLNAEQQQTVELLAQQALQDGDIKASLDRIANSHPGYEALQHALLRYRAIASKGGWEQVAEHGKIEVGSADERIKTIRKTLAIQGDLSLAEVNANPTYDKILEIAVKQFQARHGLESDGIIGPNTFAALNVTAEERAKQIELSMERLRVLPSASQEAYIHVNIPSYSLAAYKSGKKELSMNVIVGKPDRATPEFNHKISQFVVNPTWTPTYKILSKDLLPKIRNNPDYVNEGNYTVIDRHTGNEMRAEEVDWNNVTASDIRLVQNAGSSNALGKVKFPLPNNDSIYLHDTSKPYLFSRANRALSSGCIRLQKPKAFLDFVVAMQNDINKKTVDEWYSGTDNKYMSVRRTVPIYTTYLTAWVNEHGHAEFYNDIYKKDERMEYAFNKATQDIFTTQLAAR